MAFDFQRKNGNLTIKNQVNGKIDHHCNLDSKQGQYSVKYIIQVHSNSANDNEKHTYTKNYHWSHNIEALRGK